MAARSISQSDSSESSAGPGHPHEDWEDVEPDQEEIELISLFDEAKFTSVKALLDYTKEKHHFDFIATQTRLGIF
jgi:protein arginine N-methyltransferase 3